MFDDSENVAFLHDKQILAVDFDFGTRPLAEQDAIAGLDVERHKLAFFVSRSRTGGDDLALLRFLLGSVWNDDAPGVFSSAVTRRTRTRSCNGRKCMQPSSSDQRCLKAGGWENGAAKRKTT